ncbi:MAG: hypothetical protein CMB80_12500 [Flammeovirgaceae bacterium]|nr:hypothetical protein [Flammeovirgaceae bacterium]
MLNEVLKTCIRGGQTHISPTAEAECNPQKENHRESHHPTQERANCKTEKANQKRGKDFGERCTQDGDGLVGQVSG